MIRFENECVRCPSEIGCSGNRCPYMNVPHLYCDECGDNADMLYIDGNYALCQRCYLRNAQTIKIDEIDSCDNYT